MVSTKKEREREKAEREQTKNKYLEWFITIYSYIFTFGEYFIFLFEYIFVTTMAQAAFPHVKSFFQKAPSNDALTSFQMCCPSDDQCSFIATLFCLVRKDFIQMAVSCFAVGMWSFLVCNYFMWRYGITIIRYVHDYALASITVRLANCVCY